LSGARTVVSLMMAVSCILARLQNPRVPQISCSLSLH
jgi:hypothetical protein